MYKELLTSIIPIYDLKKKEKKPLSKPPQLEKGIHKKPMASVVLHGGR